MKVVYLKCSIEPYFSQSALDFKFPASHFLLFFKSISSSLAVLRQHVLRHSLVLYWCNNSVVLLSSVANEIQESPSSHIVPGAPLAQSICNTCTCPALDPSQVCCSTCIGLTTCGYSYPSAFFNISPATNIADFGEIYEYLIETAHFAEFCGAHYNGITDRLCAV